jgi:DNA-binding transcriptional MerR regulator
MRRSLRIGEVASLLGVTTKTVRHYHRLGLAAEPDRSEGGYRLYGAEELLRLLRIRKLQGLGLSLAQVGEVLGAAGEERPLRGVLESLRGTVAARIRRLEEQRERIDRLLAEPTIAAAEDGPVPAFVEEALERLRGGLGGPGGLDPEVAEKALGHDRKLFALLEELRWPDEHAAPLRAALSRFAADPAALQPMLPLIERFVALAEAPEGSPDVEPLARDLAGLAADLGKLGDTAAAGRDARGAPFRHALRGLLGSTLAPAQRRVVERMQEIQEDVP